VLPMTLDLAKLPVALIGDGDAALRRLRVLDEADVERLAIFADEPNAALAAAAGTRLTRRLPRRDEIAAARLVFLSDREAPYAAEIADWARAAGALVHIEDDPKRSDMHAPAILRRGALTIAISTAGASPGLAGRLKDFLGRRFGPEWARHLDEIAAQRRQWRAEGIDNAALSQRTADWIDRQGWLQAEPVPSRQP
jgi:precorrin-2 dehydrogenase / sirohydrochlorin ferrochelatase